MTVLLAKPEFSKEDATVAAIEFNRMEPIFARLDNEVLAEEARRRAEVEAAKGETADNPAILWLAAWESPDRFLLPRTSCRDEGSRRPRRERLRSVEAEALAFAAMREAVVEKGNFLAATSHELRSSLQAIISTIDRLAVELGELAPTELKRLRRSTDAMARHLSDLLTLAKSDAGTA